MDTERRLETQPRTEQATGMVFRDRFIATGGKTVTKAFTTGNLRNLAFGVALAALLAAGAVGAGVAGDPSQWGIVAGDPSQWGMVVGDPTQWGMVAGDPSQWGLAERGPESAFNFTKIEY